MTKQDIIEHLTNNCGLHRSSAIAAVNGVLDAITTSLKLGKDVTLRGFATLKVKNVAEKIGRNVGANTPVTIPAHRTVKFKISNELKNALNNGNEI